jgi:hypothetical protein
LLSGIPERHFDIANSDRVSVLQLGWTVDQLTVNESSIATSEILARIASISGKEPSVLPRYNRTALEHHVALWMPTDDVLRFVQITTHAHHWATDHFDVTHKTASEIEGASLNS